MVLGGVSAALRSTGGAPDRAGYDALYSWSSSSRGIGSHSNQKIFGGYLVAENEYCMGQLWIKGKYCDFVGVLLTCSKTHLSMLALGGLSAYLARSAGQGVPSPLPHFSWWGKRLDTFMFSWERYFSPWVSSLWVLCTIPGFYIFHRAIFHVLMSFWFYCRSHYTICWTTPEEGAKCLRNASEAFVISACVKLSKNRYKCTILLWISTYPDMCNFLMH